MSKLKEYRRKRRFELTPEPSGRSDRRARSKLPRFVVQKHDATRLHYDFRLEIDGVLKSWAVPKGPSMNPSDKRLAMQTEDHPLDYIDFEGRIPEGQYGAGPVIVWDAGTFEVEGGVPAAKQLERGELKFILHGEKINGGFVLVRLRTAESKGRPWLLIKHSDASVDPRWNIEKHGESVLSGREIDEIDNVGDASTAGGRNRPVAAPDPGSLSGAKKAKLPASVCPTLATLVAQPFSDPGWLFEVKWDGIRCLGSGSNLHSEKPQLS